MVVVVVVIGARQGEVVDSTASEDTDGVEVVPRAVGVGERKEDPRPAKPGFGIGEVGVGKGRIVNDR